METGLYQGIQKRYMNFGEKKNRIYVCAQNRHVQICKVRVKLCERKSWQKIATETLASKAKFAAIFSLSSCFLPWLSASGLSSLFKQTIASHQLYRAISSRFFSPVLPSTTRLYFVFLHNSHQLLGAHFRLLREMAAGRRSGSNFRLLKTKKSWGTFQTLQRESLLPCACASPLSPWDMNQNQFFYYP